MLVVLQIKDTHHKTKCKELLLLILSEENKELTVDRDQLHQIKHKCLQIEDHLAIKDSQDKEVPMLITRCLKSMIKEQCNHKIMRYLQFQLDLIPAKIINLWIQKEQVQEILLEDNQ